MTIKELENRTGMARANIRFYENEGLLHPKRLSNGYRDYSEEDMRTLKKIKLLRQLQLDLDTIRTLQKGTLTLEQALFTQMNKLEGDRAVIERAAQVCRDLERSGVEYAALDPVPYLQQLAAPPEAGQAALPPRPKQAEAKDETPRACYHPWQRLLARLMDMLLYSTVANVLWLVCFRDQSLVLTGGIMSWALGLILLVFTLAVEPVWLHYWGWTPGKWVFGLKLRNGQGEKLTLAQGFRRSCAVAWEGYGLNIPFYDLWRMWQGRKLGLEGRDCPWDGEEDYQYTKVERDWWYAAIFLAAPVVYAVALLLSVWYTQTPPNQGGLTVEQFAENYNYYFNQLIDQSSTGLPAMGDDGRWVEREAPYGTVVIHAFGDATVWADPVFTVAGGRVLAVKLHMESEDSLVSGGTREELALLAMTGALDGWNLFNYNFKGWLKVYEEQASQWRSADFTYRGLRITQQVEYDGYSNIGDQLWQVDDSAPRHCEKTVTISLAEP